MYIGAMIPQPIFILEVIHTVICRNGTNSHFLLHCDLRGQYDSMLFYPALSGSYDAKAVR